MQMLKCLVIFFLFILCNGVVVEGIFEYYVDVRSGMIFDSRGREWIFYGLNVVMKVFLWYFCIDMFDLQFFFVDVDIVMLCSWGLNVVCLGVMWLGVELQCGQVNQIYIEIMQIVVQKFCVVGIVMFFEFYQDFFFLRFCGEGIFFWVFDNINFGGMNFEDIFGRKENIWLLSWWKILRDVVLFFVFFLRDGLKVYKVLSNVMEDQFLKSFIEFFLELLSGRWLLGLDFFGDYFQ